MDGDQAGYAAAFNVNAANKVAGAFGGNHVNIDVFRRGDGAEVDIEAMGENQGLASLQAGRISFS